MEDAKQRPRRSLRDTVLRNPKNRAPQTFPFRSEPDERDNFFNNDHFFGHFHPLFKEDKDDDNRFSSHDHRFPSFGDMDHFAKGLNEMMEKFFSDFNPESFMDSRTYREDRDLDQEISSKGLDKALETRPDLNRDINFMGVRTESTITREDGTVEHKVVRKDMDGNVETTTTITRPDGTMEQIEDSCHSHDSTITETKPFGVFKFIFDEIRKIF